MINGAIQLFGGVPGRNLDPMLVVKSQMPGSTGFLMIAYENPAPEPAAACSNFYDVYFFRGPALVECARLNQDLRFTISNASALRTFAEHREGGGTTVQLYKADEEVIERLRSTFYYEPCLKVQIEALTQRQIAHLLASSRCRHGIVECNEFTRAQPSIHLFEIQSPQQLSEFRPTLRHGRLLLYDIEKNREIIRERRIASASPDPLSDVVAGGGGVPAPAPTASDPEILARLLKEIVRQAEGPAASPSPRIELSTDEVPPAEAPEGGSPKGRRIPQKTPRRAPAPAGQQGDPATVFGELWRSFRQQLLTIAGEDEGDEMIRRAEQSLRKRRPANAAGSAGEEAALLELIEETVRAAPFLKRSKIRAAAAGLISELYNRHYPMLEERHLIETIEQAYYRLKK